MGLGNWLGVDPTGFKGTGLIAAHAALIDFNKRLAVAHVKFLPARYTR
jgi:hypothetical protein